MTGKRADNKKFVGGYIEDEYKEKLDQLRYEHGNISQTEMIKLLIQEREAYGKYPPELKTLPPDPNFSYPNSKPKQGDDCAKN